MKVKEVAELVGISVRTLHHYDDIGLLKPDYTESGYRDYSDDHLSLLQQILFFRELGFSLQEIKRIVHSPNYDRAEALELHRRMLLDKRKQLDVMVATIDRTLRNMKGEIPMSNKEKFQGFDFSSNPYEQEARERWGDEAVDRSNKKLARMSKEEQQALGERFNALYRRLADIRHLPPDSEEAQTGIKEWYKLLTRMGPAHYTMEAFRALGQMYVDDERFTRNIDQFGEGLAVFLRDAMAVYADRNR